MAEVLTDEPRATPLITPSLRLPDAASAREAVGRWLMKEIGTAVYPGEATFLPDSFAWHVPIWLSYAGKTQIGILADFYVHAATGIFLGRPKREDLIHRAEALLKQAG
jgi:hypothetical protein